MWVMTDESTFKTFFTIYICIRTWAQCEYVCICVCMTRTHSPKSLHLLRHTIYWSLSISGVCYSRIVCMDKNFGGQQWEWCVDIVLWRWLRYHHPRIASELSLSCHLLVWRFFFSFEFGYISFRSTCLFVKKKKK